MWWVGGLVQMCVGVGVGEVRSVGEVVPPPWHRKLAGSQQYPTFDEEPGFLDGEPGVRTGSQEYPLISGKPPVPHFRQGARVPRRGARSPNGEPGVPFHRCVCVLCVVYFARSRGK